MSALGFPKSCLFHGVTRDQPFLVAEVNFEAKIDKWVWLKIKQEGLRRFWSMFPLTRVAFWYRFFEPQPNRFRGVGLAHPFFPFFGRIKCLFGGAFLEGTTAFFLRCFREDPNENHFLWGTDSL